MSLRLLVAITIAVTGLTCQSGGPATRHVAVAAGSEGVDEITPELRASPPLSLPPAASRTRAPELDGGIAWLGTDRPLRMSELRGHVVLVDFWTYCCINCMHTLPILAQLEARHRSDPVVVVGVHSAKFPGEREADRIAEAVARYDIRHPVVVDQENAIWNRWGVHAWPTVFVIDTQGRVLRTISGEPSLEHLDAIVNALLDEGRRENTLAAQRIAIHAPARPDTGALAYPGKVISLGGDRIAFSDSGHDRIVIAHTTGAIDAIVGQGIPGNADGDLQHAQFHHPQGIAAEPAPNGQPVNVLYVADTENHAIRRIDLAQETVTTLGAATAMRSPWDLVRVGDRLFIAMAGAHQIWRMSLDGNTVEPWAGSGREARVDGNGLAAAFAQPSGIASDGTALYVADSETSSIRAIDVATQAVRTLVGVDLFVFGDVDGDAQHARLQHPLGVATVPGEPGVVYVSDTYNHEIKRLDVATRTIRTLAGSSTRVPFFEPSGLAGVGDGFVVADTNHHRLVRLSRDGRNATPIVFRTLAAPAVQIVEVHGG